ncbi:endoribonuclease Dicer-like [Watersipora subatra]|uniref:endoribonuclease Dicer-like n=1 Tax=Watersipora subatra TaxID=2589382 RepID=UPI00355B439A
MGSSEVTEKGDSEEESFTQSFVAPDTEATVTLDNAIGLLNRYCAKLPSDIYTRLTATSSIQCVDGGYLATICLPVNCRLKHAIQGCPMPTEQSAIAAAALETCKELYTHGELDANLAPIGKEYLRSAKQDAEWESERRNIHSKGMPGSSKRKQSYQKMVAGIFHEPLQPGSACHLYIAKQSLSIAMDQQKHNKGRNVFVTEQHPYTIGFLVSSRLPEVAEFSVFTRSGQESVSITYCKEYRLSQVEFDQITSYHSFIFHNVLRIDKFPLKLNTERSKFNILVAPINTDENNIAWDYLETTLVKIEDWVKRPPLFSRATKNFVFKEENFRDAVVMPTYRNQDQPEFFYVASIRRDLSPQSPFPSPDLYKSFYTYYTSKYGLEITNSSQPLLDVDRTSVRLNLMTPRFINHKGMPLPSSTGKKTKLLTRREQQILIPELCDIHPFSASTWRKLVCVPTIIYRLNCLMLSHELLCRINKGMQLDCLSYTDVPSGDKLDLGVNFSLLAPSDVSDDSEHKSTDLSQGSADVDPDKAAEELVMSLPGIDMSSSPKSSYVANTLAELDESFSEEGREEVEEEEEETDESEDENDEEGEEDVENDSIPVDLQLDKEELSSGRSGPTVTMILQALTMSNASDFINLERLETVGDSFLKFAVTLYLFCTHPGLHEGRLSHGRGKQVSNFNLYLLGKRLELQGYLLSEKFEPTENWLPPGYVVDDTQPTNSQEERTPPSKPSTAIPYNLRTHHSIPDKGIADCVESLIGCYLTSCGPYAARVFMAWLGINVLPPSKDQSDSSGDSVGLDYGFSLPQPPSGLIASTPDSRLQLNRLYSGLEHFEESIGYTFKDKAYLVQAFSHSSYVHNNVTDCYQRLEFLGDAVIDYVITRCLFEDKRKHSPGILTDLRSALVNNNVFAALAVKWNFHKYIKFISTQMYERVHRFVLHQKARNDRIQIDQYLRLNEGEMDGEEVEIPKVLGDVFESVAGAIYIDSDMSLDTLWKVYFPLMRQQIVLFSKRIPKSPVRELLEREPETAKFQKPERTKDGRARVSVTVAGKDEPWYGEGRSYRIAKAAAAKKALIALKQMDQ